MPTVFIDGREYQAREGTNMLEVALENGLDLPYFCWHPAMGSVGSCRLCAVKVFRDESDTAGRIQMACMTPASEGTRVSIRDSEAAEFRRFVIEWLMVNHPHDCPVCDEGGECHLQDMTAMCGHVYRRYRGRKRTYRNQYLGPFINHEMNRCIQCYRCVRFYRDLAGGRDLNVFGSRNRVYFGRHEDGVLESEFSGNLVEVCPTGVFTDRTLMKHYSRKWDLETAPSVCIHCGLGCNTIPGARGGQLRRIRSRFSREVNGYFLCDRGRFGYEFVNSPRRLDACGVREAAGRRSLAWNEALESAKQILAQARGVVGIGSPRASLEANHALRRLVGDEAFSNGLSSWEHEAVSAALAVFRNSPELLVSLGEVEKADAVVVLGVDPSADAPMLDFAIRQAMRKAPLDAARKLKIHEWDANAVANVLQGARGALYTAAPWPLKIEEIATASLHLSPAGIEKIAARLLECVRGGSETGNDDGGNWVRAAAQALKDARFPLVVTGVSAGAAMVRLAGLLAQALHSDPRPAGLFICTPEANTLGVALMGGVSADEALGRIGSGDADTLVVLENDLTRRTGAPALRRAVESAQNVVVIDCLETETAGLAGLVLSSAAWVECTGTFVNSECRAQRYFQVYVPKRDVRPAWRILAELAGLETWEAHTDVLSDLARSQPVFERALLAAPAADWRAPAGRKVARMSHRFSGRTALDANLTIKEPRPPDDPESPFAFSMEGDQNPPPGQLVPRFWWPGWNSDNSINRFQIEIGGALRGGGSGVRLIEPGADGAGEPQWPSEAEPGKAEAPYVWLVPRPYTFGSEELSVHSPGVAELSPEAVLSISPAAASRTGLTEDSEAVIVFGESRYVLPVRMDESLPEDVACVPANLNKTAGITAPSALVVEKRD